MILADIRDYKNGYKKHYAAFRNMETEKSSVKSRRLLLTYSVECGLKYLLLDKWHETNPKAIIENKEDYRNKIIKSHNFERLLKELGQAGTFSFPHVETVHHDIVSPDNYHELCRYGIRITEKDQSKEEEYEEELKKVAEWIKEEV